MDWLSEKRKQIDEIDDCILEKMKRRIGLIEEVGQYKRDAEVEVMQPQRVDEIMKKCENFAEKNGLDAEFFQRLYRLIIQYSCQKEQQLKDEIPQRKIRICTLGPDGTCHDNATRHYMEFQNIVAQSEIVYVKDFTEAVTLLKESRADYIIQNCAHPQVGLLNEKYRKEVFIIDSFLFPTKSMGIIKRKNSKHKNTIGMMPATISYIEKEKWDLIIYETANPLVESGLLEDKYEYGITFVDSVDRHPEILELAESFGGPVDTAWIVYGRIKRNRDGEVLGSNLNEFLRRCQ